ncbi:MAG: hypothetical protein K8W52_40260 [Deltaproteobacteria bacterium]|nr:hypothetical protein [Deltaproteobacteria bacterium]
MRSLLRTIPLLMCCLAACAAPPDEGVGADAGVDEATGAPVGETAPELPAIEVSPSGALRAPTPDTTILGGPPSPSTVTSATFTFSSSRAGSTFQCRLDAGVWTACSSPRAYTALASGSHTFRVRACTTSCDASPATRTWTIDVTPPSVTIISGPPPVTNLASATFAFTASEAATFQCQLDGGLWSGCTSPTTYTGLAGISHTFAVRGCDAAGNCGTASRTWAVDTTPPVVTIYSGPTNPSSSPSASFLFTVSEPASVQCQLDGGAYVACSSPYAIGSLADGTHAFSVRACDAVGNCGTASYGWSIDTSPLTFTLLTAPPERSTEHTASFTFVASKPASFQCSLDGGSYAACSSPWTFPVADGQHWAYILACDGTGCTAPPPNTTWAWYVDPLF